MHQRQLGEGDLLLERLRAGRFPPLFFLRRERIFDGPSLADLLAYIHKGSAQLLVLPERRDLNLRLALR